MWTLQSCRADLQVPSVEALRHLAALKSLQRQTSAGQLHPRQSHSILLIDNLLFTLLRDALSWILFPGLMLCLQGGVLSFLKCSGPTILGIKVVIVSKLNSSNSS